MYATILRATRAHAAALRHRPEPGRVALDYKLEDSTGHVLTAGTLWVHAATESARRAHMTRTVNRLHAMWPEAFTGEARWRKVQS